MRSILPISHSVTDTLSIADHLCLTLAKEHLAFEKKLLENENNQLRLWQYDMQLQIEMLTEEKDELEAENQDLSMEVQEMQEEIQNLVIMAHELLEV